ncbi:GNAT family N-acetyltransferase [Paenibacillus nasutitermitis]|uniref:Acetyltransferase n=1 Tax=Paenibacillus nasutitermitis TaxID=1652958 RepID=A0A916YRU4_9BACL|nr:GNAT family N-acetyltransferase [Paenibacillus nasutitermitis]GGD56709.1 acetyltransferase [Paenibacillus nasutitermitis]
MGGINTVMVQLIPIANIELEAATSLWNDELGSEFPMRPQLLRQSWTEDRNVSAAGSWAAIDESCNRLAGFVVAKTWNDPSEGISFPSEGGWISVLLVHSDYRRQGIGSLLLHKAEQALREAGVVDVHLGNDLHRRLFPGLPVPSQAASAWFESKGYRCTGSLQDLLCQYRKDEPVVTPDFEDISIRLLREDEHGRIQRFMHEHFPGRWDYSTRDYWKAGGSGREFVVMEKAGELIGFCRINDSASPLLAQNIYWSPLFEGELGGVGPLGIDSAYRGRGYGAAIVQAGISILRGRGIGNIVIDATPIAAFYEQMGYRIWRTYNLYSKHL